MTHAKPDRSAQMAEVMIALLDTRSKPDWERLASEEFARLFPAATQVETERANEIMTEVRKADHAYTHARRLILPPWLSTRPIKRNPRSSK